MSLVREPVTSDDSSIGTRVISTAPGRGTELLCYEELPVPMHVPTGLTGGVHCPGAGT